MEPNLPLSATGETIKSGVAFAKKGNDHKDVSYHIGYYSFPQSISTALHDASGLSKTDIGAGAIRNLDHR